MPALAEPLPLLLDLAHQLGREERKLAILGEGNVSARATAGTFWVKASGSNLATLSSLGVTECRRAELVALLDKKNVADAVVDDSLLAARVEATAKKPSVEAMFHAWLLTLPGVNFVGHTHPVAVNQILCTKHARTFAQRRLCPDEVVCCGGESVLVPYLDPGLKLAQGIRAAVVAFIKRLTDRWIATGLHATNPVTVHDFPSTPTRGIIDLVHTGDYILVSLEPELVTTLQRKPGEYAPKMIRTDSFRGRVNRAVQYGVIMLSTYIGELKARFGSAPAGH